MLNGDADKYCQLAGKQWYEFAAARFWFRYIRKILDKIEKKFKNFKYILKFDLVKLIPYYTQLL